MDTTNELVDLDDLAAAARPVDALYVLTRDTLARGIALTDLPGLGAEDKAMIEAYPQLRAIRQRYSVLIGHLVQLSAGRPKLPDKHSRADRRRAERYIAAVDEVSQRLEELRQEYDRYLEPIVRAYYRRGE